MCHRMRTWNESPGSCSLDCKIQRDVFGLEQGSLSQQKSRGQASCKCTALIQTSRRSELMV